MATKRKLKLASISLLSRFSSSPCPLSHSALSQSLSHTCIFMPDKLRLAPLASCPIHGTTQYYNYLMTDKVYPYLVSLEVRYCMKRNPFTHAVHIGAYTFLPTRKDTRHVMHLRDRYSYRKKYVYTTGCAFFYLAMSQCSVQDQNPSKKLLSQMEIP